VTPEDAQDAADPIGRVEDALDAAARTIGQMPEADIQRRFARLQAARKARGHREIRRQNAEIDTLELEEAAFQAGLNSEEDGDLREAARWYHAAAVNDFPEASLRLAEVLTALAAEYGTGAESRPEEAIIGDALEWCAKAFAAGEIGAAELIEKLNDRLDPVHSQTQPAATGPTPATETPPGATESSPGPSEFADDQCALGGLANLGSLDPAGKLKHYQSCRSCLAELVARQPTRVPIPR
jgi:hypothetical protein